MVGEKAGRVRGASRHRRYAAAAVCWNVSAIDWTKEKLLRRRHLAAGELLSMTCFIVKQKTIKII
jgi:hypothetical protein